MANLPLGSFSIEGYRAFGVLELRKLGRVNLLTGKNNAGKTGVLEALRLWASFCSPYSLREVLSDRHEWPTPAGSPDAVPLTALLQAIRNLFHGRPSVQANPVFELIANAAGSSRVRMHLGLLTSAPSESSAGLPGIAFEWESRGSRASSETTPEGFERLARLGPEARWGVAPPASPCIYVPPSGLDERAVVLSWDEIALTPLEDRVLDALRIMAPEIERIHPVADVNGYRRGGFRVRTYINPEPVLLTSMGDGINRLLGLSIALASAQGGLLLIDEVENGIHYSVQPEIWRHIFRVAKQLDAQVFATTHSYDAVRAFQQAAAEHPDEGVLIRLNRQGDEVTATTFDEADLEVVTEEEIEVR